MVKKNRLRIGAVAALALAGVVFGAVSASADPAAGTFRTVNGVGSDTTQDVLNGLAALTTDIGSYDATPKGSKIQTTTNGPTFARPDGSTAGVQALSAAANGSGARLYPAGTGVSIKGQVDFARSSSAPSSSFVGTDLTYIPFAQDAVTYAVNAASPFPRDIPKGAASDSPTKLTLRNIYSCTKTSFTDSLTGDTIQIRPLVPQSGSGTRTFWLTALGISAYGSCVTDLNGTVQEHDGSFLTGAGDIVPFSIAQYIAQGNYKKLVSVDERRAQATLGSVSGVKPTAIDGTTSIINPEFESTFKRLVFNVVETSRLGDADIAKAFVGSNSAVCAAGSTVRAYGFATTSQCGNTTTYKQAFRY